MLLLAATRLSAIAQVKIVKSVAIFHLEIYETEEIIAIGFINLQLCAMDKLIENITVSYTSLGIGFLRTLGEWIIWTSLARVAMMNE